MTKTRIERVYLLRPLALERGPGDRVVYPAGFYSADLEPAAAWLRDGLAVPEAEWERRQKSAAAPPAGQMHAAGPRRPRRPEKEPAGRMWAQGPKGSHRPATGQGSPSTPAPAAPAPAPATSSAAVQTTANPSSEEK